MFASWLTVLVLMVWARREVAAGRDLLAAPRRWIGGVRRGHMLVALATTGVMIALVWLMKSDGAMLVALGWPEIAAISAAIDLPALLDLALIAVVAAGQARFGTLRRTPTLRPRGRRSRTHRATPPRAANDDEDRRSRAA